MKYKARNLSRALELLQGGKQEHVGSFKACEIDAEHLACCANLVSELLSPQRQLYNCATIQHIQDGIFNTGNEAVCTLLHKLDIGIANILERYKNAEDKLQQAYLAIVQRTCTLLPDSTVRANVMPLSSRIIARNGVEV